MRYAERATQLAADGGFVVVFVSTSLRPADAESATFGTTKARTCATPFCLSTGEYLVPILAKPGFPPDDLALLEALEQFERLKRSDIVRRAVRAYAAQLGVGADPGTKPKRPKPKK